MAAFAAQGNHGDLSDGKPTRVPGTGIEQVKDIEEAKRKANALNITFEVSSED